MEKDPAAKLLRIFIGENDKIGQQPLYESIVFEAKKNGLSGATVTRGVMGYGTHSKVHTAKLFEISAHLPMIIEIVDSEEKIINFISVVERLFDTAKSGGLITIENVVVMRYASGS